MQSSLKIARALGTCGLAVFLIAGSAGYGYARVSGPKADDDPIAGTPFDWTETRDVFEFGGKEPEVMDTTDREKLRRERARLEALRRAQEDRSPTERPIEHTQTERESLILAARTGAEDSAALAEKLLAKRDYSAVVDETDKGLKAIAAVQLPAPALSERLSRMQETAFRMRERANIEQEFADMQITIDGVAWSRTNPLAIINGKIMSVGETVEGALIEEIRKREVIFSLKGVRVLRGPTTTYTD
jgi:hypothetical protein